MNIKCSRNSRYSAHAYGRRLARPLTASKGAGLQTILNCTVYTATVTAYDVKRSKNNLYRSNNVSVATYNGGMLKYYERKICQIKISFIDYESHYLLSSANSIIYIMTNLSISS